MILCMLHIITTQYEEGRTHTGEGEQDGEANDCFVVHCSCKGITDRVDGNIPAQNVADQLNPQCASFSIVRFVQHFN